MKILIIDCETDSSNPVVEWLKPHECYLMTTGASLKNVSYHDINNYVGIISLDTENNDDLIYYNAEKLHQVVQFDRVIGVRKFDLLPAAYLREQWGLPGPSVAAIRAYRDKGVMKTLLCEANIDVPAFALIDNALDIINFVKRNGYPVLVKPRCSRRALGISVLKNDEALYQWLKSGLKSAPEDVINVMVKTFIEGDMYHVDGLVIGWRHQVYFALAIFYALHGVSAGKDHCQQHAVGGRSRCRTAQALRGAGNCGISFAGKLCVSRGSV